MSEKKLIRKTIKEQREKPLFHKSREINNYKPLEQQKTSTKNFLDNYRPSKGPLKPFLPHKITFAIISALTIGLLCGFTMLYLLTDKEAMVNETMDQIEEAQKVSTSSKSHLESPLMSMEVPSLKGFTLQAGVFTKLENAEEFAKTLDQVSLYPVIWEDADHFYVFVGLASTKESIEQIKETIIKKESEVFIKEWQTDLFTLEVTNVESEWLTALVDQWINLMESKENTLEQKESWDHLLESIPHESDRLIPIGEHIRNFVQTDDLDHLQIDQFLHLIWSNVLKLSNDS